MLKKRIITAVILIPIFLLFLVYASNSVFAWVTALILLAAGWEWSAFLGKLSYFQRGLYILLLGICILASIFIPIPILLFIACTWWLIAIFLIFSYPSSGKYLTRGVRLILGILTLVPCWIALNYIHFQSDGLYTLLFLFILIWGADSAAYFVGKGIGRHKLSPQVSPGKSIEGIAGALLFGILFTLFVLWYLHIPSGMWIWGLSLSTLTILFSVVGDLSESMFKRESGVKDSGSIFPGHGGLLDRIDSLTAAAPMFTLYAIMIGKILEG